MSLRGLGTARGKMLSLFLTLLFAIGCLIHPTVEVSMAGCKLDIAFVVDSSSSIYVEDFKKQRSFLHDVISMFDNENADVQFAAVSFSNYVFDEFRFDNYSNQADILAATNRIRYSAGDATRTYLGIENMRDNLFGNGHGARDDAVHVGVVLTDGATNPGSYDNYSGTQGKAKTQAEARAAKEMGIHMFAVGIGNKVDLNELQGIASDPDEKFVITVDTYQKLDTEQIKKLLACRVCKAPAYDHSFSFPRRSLYASLFDNNISLEERRSLYARATNVISSEEVRRECHANPVDIIFILDESTSIGSQENFRKELDFVRDVSDMFDIGPQKTHISVITYSDESQMRFSLHKYMDKSSLEHAIENIDWRTGNTYTNKALDLLLSHSLSEVREGISHIGILITDGKSTDTARTRVSAHNVLATGEIEMFAIGIGNAYRPELDMLASKPSNEYVYQIDNLDSLNMLKNRFVYRVCKEKPGCGEIERCEAYRADLVVLSDASYSITDTNFVKQKEFIKSLVSMYNIGPDAVQVGMISFSTDAHIDFNLNSYGNEKNLTDAISRVHYMGGDTSTDVALDLMSTNSFTRDAGARDGVPKVAFVITDGAPQNQRRTKTMADKAKAQGIMIYAIGIGSEIKMENLKAVASSPANHFTFMIEDFDSLMGHVGSIIQNTCQTQVRSHSGQ